MGVGKESFKQNYTITKVSVSYKNCNESYKPKSAML